VADKLSVKRRSWNMSRIRSRDTNPELIVRKALTELGYRFRLHRKDLPGKPDIVLPKYRTAIFVHGCFWHQHSGCIDCSNPKTNSKYWRPKLLANVQRDRKHRRRLRRLGWTPVVIWECEVLKCATLRNRLTRKLTGRSTI
jgi:DNA mismatch endonuclease, patch repair protein